MTLDSVQLALQQLHADLVKAHSAVSSPANEATLAEARRWVEQALPPSASVTDTRNLLEMVRNAASALKKDPQHEASSAAETALEKVRQDMTRVFTELDAATRGSRPTERTKRE